MTERKSIDWESIEREYRAGLRSARELGEQYGVSHTAINKRAAREGWDRDLSARIKAKADAKVSKAMVSTKVSSGNEREIIEANAAHVAEVQLRERGTIKRQRELGERLLAEVEAQTLAPELYEQLGELMRDPESNRDRLAELYQKIISTSGRLESFQKLVMSTKSLIDTEWKIYRLEDKTQENGATPQIDMQTRVARLAGLLALAEESKDA